MPRAVRFHHYGDIDVLQVGDVERPVPGPGQVLVNDPKCRSYTHLVKRLLQSYEYTFRNRYESRWTFSMHHADELLSPNVCKIANVSRF
jgi:hypothetical protein